MPLLTCKKVRFYAEGDELSFFNWVKNIKAIKKYYGVGDTIYLKLNTSKLSDNNLRELIALFYRYKIEMTQLKQFLSESNKGWFQKNLQAFWHRQVFGKK